MGGGSPQAQSPKAGGQASRLVDRLACRQAGRLAGGQTGVHGMTVSRSVGQSVSRSVGRSVSQAGRQAGRQAGWQAGRQAGRRYRAALRCFAGGGWQTALCTCAISECQLLLQPSGMLQSACLTQHIQVHPGAATP